MFNRGEINEDDQKLMRPRSAQIGRAHGLPKIHKEYTNLPPFRPIIDTTNTPYYEVGKFLTSLLEPLTKNQYVVKDSFEAVDRIKDIPKEYFEQGYKYVSFDLESLFTSVPLKKTIQVILDRVYQEEKIITNLQKRTLKKLLKDACHKTTFSFNNVLYEQIDGVSMGSPLGPTMADIIMTELERIIVDDLMADGVIKFYMRYVDDTLVLIKSEEIQKVLDKLNSFDKNLRFTHDPFSDGDTHFLDIRIRENTRDIYYKDTHTGQYTHFSSYSPWCFKVAWIKALYSRAEKICSNKELFQGQIKRIREFMSWNGFPRYVGNSILRKLEKRKTVSNEVVNDDSTEEKTVWFRVPYAGPHGKHLVKTYVKKLQRCLKEKVRFSILYDLKKVSYFCSVKDKVPDMQRAHVIYRLRCPGCGDKYIGKTE